MVRTSPDAVDRERFYGRRKGKALRAGQQARLDRLLPGLSLDLEAAAPDRLESLFPRRPAKLVLEIGFGGGEHLAAEAEAHPDTGYIGAEPFLNGVAKLVSEIEARNLANIRVHHGDARPLLDWLPASALDRIDLLYPDPWPKARHWKRRFINRRNLDRLARVLKPGGLLHFATDIDSYTRWTLAHIHAHTRFLWTASAPSDWRTPFPDWPGTRYEAKARAAGRDPVYLEFRRIDGT